MSLLNEDRLSAALANAELDVLVATSLENVHYATNYRSFTQELMRGAEFFVVIPEKASGPRTLIAPMSELDRIAEVGPEVDEIVPYGFFSFTPPADKGTRLNKADKRLLEIGVDKPEHASASEALLACLEKNGLRDGRIGIDESGISTLTFERLKEELPSATVEPCYQIWQWVRMVKTEQEISLLRKSVAATEAAFKATLDALREGITEQELTAVFNKQLIEEGAFPAFAVIAFGSHGAYPNAAITNRTLQNGDTIRYDIGCTYGGYYSDIARTVAFGNPSDKLQSYYSAILEGEERAVEKLCAGNTAEEVFDVAIEATRRAGIPDYARNHVGHGIGIEIYDPPVLRPNADIALEPGMVFCVETPYYELGWTGIQVEDTLVVTESGPKYLTTVDRNLIVV